MNIHPLALGASTVALVASVLVFLHNAPWDAPAHPTPRVLSSMNTELAHSTHDLLAVVRSLSCSNYSGDARSAFPDSSLDCTFQPLGDANTQTQHFDATGARLGVLQGVDFAFSVNPVSKSTPATPASVSFSVNPAELSFVQARDAMTDAIAVVVEMVQTQNKAQQLAVEQSQHNRLSWVSMR